MHEKLSQSGAGAPPDLSKYDGPDAVKGDDGGFPPNDILLAARMHFQIGKIGAPQKYERPFTRQLKNDTRLQFPVDERYYALAEKAQSDVLARYLSLQVIEVSMLALLVAIQALLFAPDRLMGSLDLPFLKNLTWPWALGSGVLAAAIFAALRSFVRWFFFHEIERKAERLSFEVFKRIDDINTNVTEACLKSRNRKGRGEWSERAREWIVVAIWNAKRAEYLDRFITTLIWSVRTYIVNIEIAAVLLKFAVALIAAVYVFRRDEAAASFAFCGAILVQTGLLWLVWGRKPADFWTTVFRKSASEHEENVEPYSDKIASVVENLVHEALGKEFGAGSKTS